MKKFKFKLNRKAISLMYTSFIRPHLEYASDVWGGCSLTNAEKLEQMQLLAAGIVYLLVRLLSITKQVGFHYSVGARKQDSKLCTRWTRVLYPPIKGTFFPTNVVMPQVI